MKQRELFGPGPGELTQDRLKYLLSYDPDTGVFRWRVFRPPYVIPGSVAGCVHYDGYRVVTVDGTQYRGGRLAFFYMTGRWPVPTVDHINRDRLDDRWCNLREADISLQILNRDMPERGLPVGVYRHRSRFTSKITRQGVVILLGTFDSPEDASAAFKAAAAVLDS